MARGQRRKCKCCRRSFRPDLRNRHHQRYCSEPPCRAASKAASHARWLSKPENQGWTDGFAEWEFVAREAARRVPFGCSGHEGPTTTQGSTPCHHCVNV